MRNLRIAFFNWLPLGIAVICICGLIYAVVQQNYRQSLNDPQIQMTEDAITALNTGKQPAEIVNKSAPVNISKSLLPFLAIYDEKGKLLVTDGNINGDSP